MIFDLHFEGCLKDFLGLVSRFLGCKPKPKPSGPFFTLTREGEDEPIAKDTMSRVTIPGGPIEPGNRRKFRVAYDKPVDLLPDGVNYIASTPVEGDSSIAILEQDENGALIAFNGDGSVGAKVGSLRVDGARGPREVSIVQEYAWEVGAKDATTITLGLTPEGPDEPIPA